MKRGEIWLGRLNPARGAEVGKTRPVLILQADFLTAQGHPTVIVVPLTSQVRPGTEPPNVYIAPRGGLKEPSQAMPDQPRTLDRSRLLRGPLTRLTGDEMRAVEKSLLTALGMHR